MWCFSRKNIIDKTYKDTIIDKNNVPVHIAIIMDGNGRWAKQKKIPRAMGHKAGVETIRSIVKESNKIGIKYLTLYAFSTENWKRPLDEVNALMRLLFEYLRNEVEELHKNGVIVNHIGDISKLPDGCRKELLDAYNKTKNNKGLMLNLAINYGGRDEITMAIRNIVKDVKKGVLIESKIDENLITKYLYTSKIPDPDLIIRPSGEQRISNFLLWQGAYSELWFSNINWPDFSVNDLHRAISDYQKRNRRFGGI